MRVGSGSGGGDGAFGDRIAESAGPASAEAAPAGATLVGWTDESAALRQLAQITDFDLFVTTTFDPLLEQAVNLERFGGQPHTDVISYAPNRVSDLPAERGQLQRPVVYHMLGKLSASPTYVVSDEDMLEFICALQSEHLTPEKLFHELEHNHLLLIGSLVIGFVSGDTGGEAMKVFTVDIFKGLLPSIQKRSGNLAG